MDTISSDLQNILYESIAETLNEKKENNDLQTDQPQNKPTSDSKTEPEQLPEEIFDIFLNR